MPAADTSARALAAAAPVRLSSIDVRLVRLTLVRPFETSFGRVDARVVPLVRMQADGVEGWGEIVADHEPLFSAETADSPAFTSDSVRIRYLIRSAIVIIGRRCFLANLASSGTRAMVPSSFMISQMTPDG